MTEAVTESAVRPGRCQAAAHLQQGQDQAGGAGAGTGARAGAGGVWPPSHAWRWSHRSAARPSAAVKAASGRQADGQAQHVAARLQRSMLAEAEMGRGLEFA